MISHKLLFLSGQGEHKHIVWKYYSTLVYVSFLNTPLQPFSKYGLVFSCFLDFQLKTRNSYCFYQNCTYHLILFSRLSSLIVEKYIRVSGIVVDFNPVEYFTISSKNTFTNRVDTDPTADNVKQRTAPWSHILHIPATPFFGRHSDFSINRRVSLQKLSLGVTATPNKPPCKTVTIILIGFDRSMSNLLGKHVDCTGYATLTPFRKFHGKYKERDSSEKTLTRDSLRVNLYSVWNQYCLSKHGSSLNVSGFESSLDNFLKSQSMTSYSFFNKNMASARDDTAQNDLGFMINPEVQNVSVN